MSKTIVVFGATGLQGGSVIKAILNDSQLSKEYTIRGITRDSSKPNAQALAKQGVELTNADLHSKDSVLAALKGAEAVFFMTNYWEVKSHEIEIQQGKNVADAAKEAGVTRVIFSSLENVTKISNGKLKHVLHFDGKNDIEQYIRGQDFEVAGFVYPGFYMSNLVGAQFRKGEDGVHTFAMPTSDKAQFPLFDTAADFGKFTIPLLRLPASKANGLIIRAATDYYTPTRIVEEWEQVTGKKAKFASLPADVFKSFLPPDSAQELLENMQLMDGPGYYNGAELESSLELIDGKPTTFKDFVKKQKQWLDE